MNIRLREKTLPGGQTLEIIQGDIIAEKVDAIVNAANEQLDHGGGVAWAISRAGGPKLQAESDAWVRTRPGQPRRTGDSVVEKDMIEALRCGAWLGSVFSGNHGPMATP